MLPLFHRDIFYQDPSVFGSQSCLDEIVDTISCMLRVPRNRLHIVRHKNAICALILHTTYSQKQIIDKLNLCIGQCCQRGRFPAPWGRFQTPGAGKKVQGPGAAFGAVFRIDNFLQKLLEFCAKWYQNTKYYLGFALLDYRFHYLSGILPSWSSLLPATNVFLPILSFW